MPLTKSVSVLWSIKWLFLPARKINLLLHDHTNSVISEAPPCAGLFVFLGMHFPRWFFIGDALHPLFFH
jgi:hypothetical protein